MKKILLIFLLFFLSITIPLAQVTTDIRKDNASVFQARNGINVINIAKPNPNGISKNTYTDFNISSEGVVFNNSTSEGRSRLAGIILGNSNYTIGDSARLILNQVTSSNSSSLEGFGEVFGSNAGVIIANPNGISCSGCGFINASQVSLVTGTVNDDSISSGNPTFNINNDNKITISGDGFNGSEVDYLNLVSRYHSIQAQITAKEKIRILSGNNTYDSNNFTLNSTTGVAQNGEFAVDISALANMQAGSIIVIGTEKGLGVNSQGRVVASLSGVEIDSAGKMVLNEITSTQNITLKSQAGITTTTNSYLQAGGSINIEASGISLNSILAYGDFTASTDGNFENSASLRATNFTITSQRATLGDITADGNFSLLTQGSASIDGNLDVFSDAIFSIGDNFRNYATITAGSFNVTAKSNFFNQDSATINTNSFDVAVKQFVNRDSAAINAGSFNITAKTNFFNISATINANSFAVTTANNFTNYGSATINANSFNVTVESNFFNQDSATINADTVTIEVTDFANDVTNTGTVSANTLNFILTNDFTRSSTSFNGFTFNNLDVSTDGYFNNEADLTINSFDVTAGGYFYNESATINAGSFDVAAENFWNGNLATINADSLNIVARDNFNNYNLSTISVDSLKVTAGTSFGNNNGTITADSFAVTARTYFENGATINAGSFDVTAGTYFYNSGNVTKINADTFNVTVGDNFYNTNSTINADSFNVVVENDFHNGVGSVYSGMINAGSFNVVAGDDFNNINSSTIIADSVTIEVTDFADIYNTATISTDNLNLILTNSFTHTTTSFNGFTFNNLGITTDGSFFNYADLTVNSFNVTVGGGFYNHYETISADSFNVTTGFLFRSYATINAGSFNLTVGGFFSNESSATINADSFNVTTENNFSNRATINTNNFDITARDFNNFGTITADNFDITVRRDFNNYEYGTINAGSFNVVAGADFHNGSNLYSEAIINADSFNVTVGGGFYNGYDSNRSTYSTINASSFNVTADDFYNIKNATINAGSFNVTTSGDFYNRDNATISAGSFNVTTSGDFYNRDDATISAGSFNVTTSGDFYNRDDATISAGSFSVLAGGSFSNNNATISANNLNVSADYFNNGSIDVVSTSKRYCSQPVFFSCFNHFYYDQIDVSYNGGNITAYNLNIKANHFENISDIVGYKTYQNLPQCLPVFSPGFLYSDCINNIIIRNSEIQANNFNLTVTNSLYIRYGDIRANNFNILTNNFYNYSDSEISVRDLSIAVEDTFSNIGDIQAGNLDLAVDKFSNSGNITTNTTNFFAHTIVDDSGNRSTGNIFNQVITISTPDVPIFNNLNSGLSSNSSVSTEDDSSSANNITNSSIPTEDPNSSNTTPDSSIPTEDPNSSNTTSNLYYSYQPPEFSPRGTFDVQPLTETTSYTLEVRPEYYNFADTTPTGNTNTLIDTPLGRDINVINIAKPDANGLSNNTYEIFNIPNQGIIFNNSDIYGTSKLAGDLFKNPNYSDGDLATLILNQITSNNRSFLNGYGEIFGAQAGLIIANPNGITCSGCGFINANRVDLITGTSNFNSNTALTEFSINNADITINENYFLTDNEIIKRSGLDGIETDNLNLVSRYHNIQAGSITGKNLLILSGNNKYDYINSILDSTTATTSLKEFAINISSLTKLQADSISLRSTESGLGINSQGNLISSSGEIEIDAAGKLLLHNITSNQNINIKSNAALTTNANSKWKANGDINIEAEDIVLNSAMSIGDFIASSDNNFTNTANLRAKNFIIKAYTTTLGDITADGNFIVFSPSGSITDRSDITVAGNLVVSGDTYIQSGYNFTNTGNINSNALTIIAAKNFHNTGSITTNNSDITAFNNFYNEDNGNINAEFLNITTNKDFYNQNKASINAEGLSILAEEVFYNQNESNITADDFSLKASDFQNDSNSNIAGDYIDLIIDNDFYNTENNRANIKANSLNIFTTGSFYNQFSDSFQVNNLNIIAASDIASSNFYNGENITLSANNLSITADNFENKGAINIGNDLNLSIVNNTTNDREILTGNNLTIKTTDFANTDLLVAFATIDIQTKTNFSNQKGTIYSFGNMYLIGGVSADGSYLKSNSFRNEGGWIESSGDLEIHSNSIENNRINPISYIKTSGTDSDDIVWRNTVETENIEGSIGRIYSGGNMKLIASGNIINYLSYIRSNNSLHIEGNSFKNDPKKLIQIYYKGAYTITNRTRRCYELGFTLFCDPYVTTETYYPSTSTTSYTGYKIISIVSVGGTISGNLENKFSNGEVTTADVPDEDPNSNIHGTKYEYANNYDYKANTPTNPLTVAQTPLFTIAPPSATRKYAIESRFDIAKIQNLYGADYFFMQLGIELDDGQQALGDSFYDNKKIQEDITRLAADALIGEADMPFSEKMKLLLDNAISLAEALQLAPGVALTPDQLDRLTKNIVWYVEEEITINGVTRKYLVPRVYLSKLVSAKIDAADGSIISGRTVNIVVQGNMTATINAEESKEIANYLKDNQQAQIDLDIANLIKDEPVSAIHLSINDTRLENNLTTEQRKEYDAIVDKKLVDARAKFEGALNNKIAQMRKEGKSESEIKRVKETDFDEQSYTNLIKKAYFSILGNRERVVNSGTIRSVDGTTIQAGNVSNTGTLQSDNALNLIASNNINSSGSLQAGNGGIYLNAQGSINVESLYKETEDGENIDGVIYQNASVRTTGNFTAIAGQDINIVAADVNAGEDIYLIAEGNISAESIGVINKEQRSDGFTKTTTHAFSNINAGGNLITRSGGNTVIQGANLEAQGDVDIHADGGLYVVPVYNTTEGERNTRGRGGDGIFKSAKGNDIKTTWYNATAVSSSIKSGGSLSLSGNTEVLLKAAELKAGKDGKNDLYLTSKEGAIRFETAEESNYYSRTEKGRGSLWQKDKGDGHNNSTQKDNNIQGNLKIKAAKGVKLDYVKQKTTKKRCVVFKGCRNIDTYETDEEAKARLQKEGGWQSQVLAQAGDSVEFTGKTNSYQSLDYNNSGLTEEAALAVTLVVAGATGGVGGAIIGAGLSSLATVAAVSLINEVGRGNNLEGALTETSHNTFTEENLRNAAVASVTAAAVSGIDALAGVEKTPTATDYGAFGNEYVQKLAHTTVGTAVQSLAAGETLKEFGYRLEADYKAAVIDTVAEKGANFIGENLAADSKAGGIGSAAYLGHKAAHAGLGCAVGIWKAGDCKSGAFGGVAGEIVGEAVGNNTDLSDAQVSTISQIATIFPAGANGLDINVAQQSAKNAVENNFLYTDPERNLEKAKELCFENNMKEACDAVAVLEKNNLKHKEREEKEQRSINRTTKDILESVDEYDRLILSDFSDALDKKKGFPTHGKDFHNTTKNTEEIFKLQTDIIMDYFTKGGMTTSKITLKLLESIITTESLPESLEDIIPYSQIFRLYNEHNPKIPNSIEGVFIMPTIKAMRTFEKLFDNDSFRIRRHESVNYENFMNYTNPDDIFFPNKSKSSTDFTKFLKKNIDYRKLTKDILDALPNPNDPPEGGWRNPFAPSSNVQSPPSYHERDFSGKPLLK